MTNRSRLAAAFVRPMRTVQTTISASVTPVVNCAALSRLGMRRSAAHDTMAQTPNPMAKTSARECRSKTTRSQRIAAIASTAFPTPRKTSESRAPSTGPSAIASDGMSAGAKRFADPQQEDVLLNRLADEIRADLETLDLQLGAGLAGDEDHRRAETLSRNDLGQRQTVKRRHGDVAHDDVEMATAQLEQRLGAVARCGDIVSRAAEKPFEDCPRHGLVFDDQHGRARRLAVRCGVGRGV